MSRSTSLACDGCFKQVNEKRARELRWRHFARSDSGLYDTDVCNECWGRLMSKLDEIRAEALK